MENDAAEANKAIAAYKPFFSSRQEFFDYQDRINKDFDAVTYDESGDIILHV
jgi:hypothetical protein